MKFYAKNHKEVNTILDFCRRIPYNPLCYCNYADCSSDVNFYEIKSVQMNSDSENQITCQIKNIHNFKIFNVPLSEIKLALYTSEELNKPIIISNGMEEIPMIWFMQYMLKTTGLLKNVTKEGPFDNWAIKVTTKHKNKSFLLSYEDDDIVLYVCTRKNNSIILEVGTFNKNSIEGKELLNTFNSAPKNYNYFNFKDNYNYYLEKEYKDNKVLERYFLLNNINRIPDSSINTFVLTPLSLPRDPSEIFKNPYYRYNNHDKKSIDKFLQSSI